MVCEVLDAGPELHLDLRAWLLSQYRRQTTSGIRSAISLPKKLRKATGLTEQFLFECDGSITTATGRTLDTQISLPAEVIDGLRCWALKMAQNHMVLAKGSLTLHMPKHLAESARLDDPTVTVTKNGTVTTANGHFVAQAPEPAINPDPRPMESWDMFISPGARELEKKEIEQWEARQAANQS